MTTAPSDDPATVFEQLISDIGTAMLTSANPEGAMHSRPLRNRPMIEGNTIWFLAHEGADWVPQPGLRVPANLAFTTEARWVSAAGTAFTKSDATRLTELVNGRSDDELRGDDQDLVALGVEVDSVSYWRSKSKDVGWLELVKGALTGTEDDLGRRGTFDLPEEP